jgi:hypothetical protein
MKKKQKYVTIFVVLLFCVLARAEESEIPTGAMAAYLRGDCVNASVLAKVECDKYSAAGNVPGVEKCNQFLAKINSCLISQGDEAYNRAVDYFMRGASYLNSSDVSRALMQLNLSKTSLLEANLSYSRMQPTDSQMIARVDAAYLQASEKIAEAAPSGTVTQPSLAKSSESSSTTLMMKVTSTTVAQESSPSGSQILLVASAIVVLSVVGFMFLKRSGK